MQAPIRELSRRRFLFVTGKGGVGKTSVAVALGRSMAQSGQRVLLAASAEGDAMANILGVSELPPEVSLLEPNLYAVRITLERALVEYGHLVLRGGRLFDAAFGNATVQSFFRGVPGLSEWAILGKAWYHSTELLASGEARFDTVILDAPATGHGVSMLWVPQVVVELSPHGLLKRDAERALEMFRDPVRSGVVVVTLAEEMPVNETLELAEAVRGELGLPLGLVVINAVKERLFTPEEALALAVVEEAPGPLGQAGERARFELAQAAQIERLSALGVACLELPDVEESASSAKVAVRLGEALTRGRGAD